MNFLWAEPPGAGTGFSVYRKRTETVLKRHPGSTGMAKMLFGGQRAVDVLVSLPGVDPGRIGCAGHSLGAKEALYLAALDPRITATVSSEGGTGIELSNWHDLWYLGPAAKAPGFDLDHHQLLALVAPRPFLLIAGESADGEGSQPYLKAARPVYELYGKPDALQFIKYKTGHTFPVEMATPLTYFLATHLKF